MYELAKIYIHLDFKVGLDWFLSAAMENHDEAKYYLGDFYINGDVVDKDIEYGSGFFVDIIESGSMSDTIIAKLELFYKIYT